MTHGSTMAVWRWTGDSAEEAQGTYLGQTKSTGEHVVTVMEWGDHPMILGRQVFDVEEQARWFGRGSWEAHILAIEWRMEHI